MGEPACIDGRVGISKPTKSMVFAVFSQTTQFFFQILLFPLEEFLRHLLKKLKLVKSKNFPLKKFRTFFSKKNKKIGVFCKNLENFSIVFLVFTFIFRHEKNPFLKKRKKINTFFKNN